MSPSRLYIFSRRYCPNIIYDRLVDTWGLHLGDGQVSEIVYLSGSGGAEVTLLALRFRINWKCRGLLFIQPATGTTLTVTGISDSS